METPTVKQPTAVQSLVGKRIPDPYRKPILDALSKYPELDRVSIDFVPQKNHPVPYSTTPYINTIFFGRRSRRYKITLREEASGPLEQALFKNLPYECQVAVIAHELGHVLQYEARGLTRLLTFFLRYLTVNGRRHIERSADIKVIEHGLAKNLYAQAMYVRSIPGYVEERKEIEIYYLKPAEILQVLSEKELGVSI